MRVVSAPPAAISATIEPMQGQAAHGIDHYENFPVASWLTPARLRPAIVAIYWFARTADDIADEGDASAGERLHDLAAFRTELYACASGDAAPHRWPQVFAPLRKTIAAHKLPLAQLDALLQAFEQDVRYSAQGRWYASHAELLDYCSRSANPIGRLLLHLYGVHGEQEWAAADAICSALQLINVWQDLSKDIPRSRYYLPLDKLAAHQNPTSDVLRRQDTALTMKIIESCVGFSTRLMQQGFALPQAVRRQVKGFDGWRLSLELRCVIHGGLRILEKIAHMQHRTLAARPSLTLRDGIIILWRALRHAG